MTMQNYFVLTSVQRTAVMALNGEEVTVDPRAIDSATPGSGINTNQDATGFGVGDAVALTGRFVAPVRIVNDPEYLSLASDIVTYLLDMPAAALEDETIFLPPPPPEL